MTSLVPILRCLAVAGMVGLTVVSSLEAQSPAGEAFPGVKKALSTQQFEAAGLGNLSQEQQAKLDSFLRDYFSGASQRVAEQAASQAVDRAVKNKRADAPTLIESRIVGTVNGWNIHTVFLLENGERWKPVAQDKASFPPVENPQVFIVRDAFGYKMAILGGAVLRVRRVR